MNYHKWLPVEDKAIQEYLINCKKLYPIAHTLEFNLTHVLSDTDEGWQVCNLYSNLCISGGVLGNVSQKLILTELRFLNITCDRSPCQYQT